MQMTAKSAAAIWAANSLMTFPGNGAKREAGVSDETTSGEGGVDGSDGDRGIAECWSRISQRLRVELGEDVHNSWFASVEADTVRNGTVFLTVPTKFLKNWITEHYNPRILKHWEKERDDVLSVEIVLRTPKAHRTAAVVQPRQAEVVTLTPPRAPAIASVPIDAGDGADGLASPLDPRFTFASFSVGQSNGLAHAAAMQVARAATGDPVQFNPYYIHSSVGRGKTHLLQAIAAHIQGTNSGRTVLYLTAEAFMHRFVAALKADRTLSFKDRLRGIDVLIIDDMQFLQGKTIQQEFCHTLNSLLDGNRQVVVAADRPPADLDGLEERVRSRLAGGLTVEIAAPEHSLRIAMLKARAAAAARKYPGFELPEPVIETIAAQVKTNGRDLEGVFNRLLAHNQFGKVPISVDLAEKTVRGHVRPEEPRRIRIEDIQRAVAQHFNVSKSDLLSARRNRSIVRPRQIAMYLSKHMTPRSLPEIGRRFGGRDHTTVLHAVRKIEELIAADVGVARDVDLLKRHFEDQV